jgi:hypothetical protein
MKPSNDIIYEETFNAMRRALKLLKKDSLNEKEIKAIKGAIMYGSFMYKDAIKDEMYGFMSIYTDLLDKWSRRKNNV